MTPTDSLIIVLASTNFILIHTISAIIIATSDESVDVEHTSQVQQSCEYLVEINNLIGQNNDKDIIKIPDSSTDQRPI